MSVPSRIAALPTTHRGWPGAPALESILAGSRMGRSETVARPAGAESSERPHPAARLQRMAAMSEYYTHLLIPVSKAFRPTGDAVTRCMDELIQNRYVGDDYQIRLCGVTRVEPRIEEWPNPFTGKMGKQKTPSRRRQRGDIVSATSQILAFADTNEEYDVLVASTLRPRSLFFEVGSMAKDGKWSPWSARVLSGPRLSRSQIVGPGLL